VFEVRLPPDGVPPPNVDICAALLDDEFGDQQACTPQGAAFDTNADVREEGGRLVIAPLGVDSSGGCHYDGVGLSGFTAVQVSSVLVAGGAYTAFQLPAFDRSLFVSNGRLVYSPMSNFQDLGSATYVPAAMAWWRMRPDRVAKTVAAEYSADGRDWKLLATSGAVASSVTEDIYLIAGFNGEAANEAAVIERLVVCP
jgi:hypothetical protein